MLPLIATSFDPVNTNQAFHGGSPCAETAQARLRRRRDDLRKSHVVEERIESLKKRSLKQQQSLTPNGVEYVLRTRVSQTNPGRSMTHFALGL